MVDPDIKLSTVCIRGGLIAALLSAFFLMVSMLSGITFLHPLIGIMIFTNGLTFAVIGWVARARCKRDE